MSNPAGAYAAYRRAFNRAVHGEEEPSARQLGRYFDQRHGLWLPPRFLKARRAPVA